MNFYSIFSWKLQCFLLCKCFVKVDFVLYVKVGLHLQVYIWIISFIFYFQKMYLKITFFCQDDYILQNSSVESKGISVTCFEDVNNLKETE